VRKKKRDKIMERMAKAEEISCLYETKVDRAANMVSTSIANSIIGDPWGGQWQYDRYVAPPNVYPSTGTNPVVYPDPPSMVFNECSEKHVIEEIAQYPDGVFGNCAKCSARVQIPTVPGGYTAVQVRGFLERVIAGDESEDDGELLVELGKLLAILDLEEEELLLAKNRVQIARTILTDRAAV
jgi:hypothetical protein